MQKGLERELAAIFGGSNRNVVLSSEERSLSEDTEPVEGRSTSTDSRVMRRGGIGTVGVAYRLFNLMANEVHKNNNSPIVLFYKTATFSSSNKDNHDAECKYTIVCRGYESGERGQ